jgi:cytosine-specific methyltransferase
MVTFSDLFSGGGTAATGLREAGLKHVVAVEYWAPAADNYRANGGGVIEEDIRDVISIPKSDVVWASPPCTEYSNGSNHRPKREEIKDLVIDAVRVALTADPRAIVLENHPHMLHANQYRTALAMAADAGLKHVREYVVDAADYGSPCHRRRCFVTISRADIDEIDWGKRRTTAWNSVIDPVWDGDWRTTGHAPRMKAKLGDADMCLYNYYSQPTAAMNGQPAKTITTVPRSVAIRADGARYWPKSDDYRKLMGLPDSFVLIGSERDRCKIIGNGVAFVSSYAIGKHLAKSLD